MVTATDLRVDQAVIESCVARVGGGLSIPDPAEYFASLAWSVICEPGDAFAGKLIAALGSGDALALELANTSPAGYRHRFEADGLDWFEMQSFGQFEKTLSEARERWKARLSLAVIEKAIRDFSVVQGWFIDPSADCWPSSFQDLGAHAPRGLWIRGELSAIEGLGKSVSIVGSRMASAYGDYATGELIGGLVSRGITVVSGGAYGIDAMAHRAALAVQLPTVAVMAGGLDRLYPSGNSELFKQIERKGALISEMPPGAEPTKWRFLQRNRLIAALGGATVVVEANPRSGAVSTANRALELGRALGAVPGPINAPGSDGCHRLIREDSAVLISSSEDLLDLLGYQAAEETTLQGLGAIETRVLDVIGFGDADYHQVCAEAGLTRDEARMGLASLSLLGLIQQNANSWSRVAGT